MSQYEATDVMIEGFILISHHIRPGLWTTGPHKVGFTPDKVPNITKTRTHAHTHTQCTTG